MTEIRPPTEGFAFCLCGYISRRLYIVQKSNLKIDWVFVAGSGMLGISIYLNAVSTHGTCTAIFVAVAAIVGFMLSSIQTLGRLSWVA